MQKTLTITWMDEILEVTGEYELFEKGDGHIQPDSSASFTAEKIMYKGVDVFPIIHSDQQETMEYKCLTQLIN